jgi:hypothetical protein
MTKETAQLMTPVDPKTGDVPAETPGHVVPGKDLRRRLGLASSEEKPADKPAEKPNDTPNPVEKPEVKKVPVKAHKRTIVRHEAPALDPETLTNVVSTAVKTALAVDKPAPADPTSNLSTKQKREYTVLKRMESSDAALKGKAAAYLESLSKLAAYKLKWESDHPGAKFDPKDADHEVFVAANEVTWDEDAYLEALADMRAEEKAAEAIKPLQDKLTAREAEESKQARVRELVPKIVTHQKATAMTFFSQLGDAYKGVLDQGGTVVQDELKRLSGERAVNKQVFALAQKTEYFAGEVKRIATGLTEFVETNPLHQEIFGYAAAQEQAMLNQAPDKQLDSDGRQFVPLAQWQKLSEEQRKSRWTFSDNDLSALYAVDAARRAKQLIEDDERDYNSRLEREGIKRPAKPVPTAPVEAHSPSGTVAPRMAPVKPQPINATKSLLQRITG